MLDVLVEGVEEANLADPGRDPLLGEDTGYDVIGAAMARQGDAARLQPRRDAAVVELDQELADQGLEAVSRSSLPPKESGASRAVSGRTRRALAPLAENWRNRAKPCAASGMEEYQPWKKKTRSTLPLGSKSSGLKTGPMDRRSAPRAGRMSPS